jgi:RNA-directed DNA polymerase
MTGYRWSTPAVDMGAVTVNGPEGQARDEDATGWDAIDWRSCEDQVQRLRQRIFMAAREQDWPKVRNLQKPATPSRLA